MTSPKLEPQFQFIKIAVNNKNTILFGFDIFFSLTTAEILQHTNTVMLHVGIINPLINEPHYDLKSPWQNFRQLI